MRLQISGATWSSFDIAFDGRDYVLQRAESGGDWWLTTASGDTYAEHRTPWLAAARVLWPDAVGRALAALARSLTEEVRAHGAEGGGHG